MKYTMICMIYTNCETEKTFLSCKLKQTKNTVFCVTVYVWCLTYGAIKMLWHFTLFQLVQDSSLASSTAALQLQGEPYLRLLSVWTFTVLPCSGVFPGVFPLTNK